MGTGSRLAGTRWIPHLAAGLRGPGFAAATTGCTRSSPALDLEARVGRGPVPVAGLIARADHESVPPAGEVVGGVAVVARPPRATVHLALELRVLLVRPEAEVDSPMRHVGVMRGQDLGLRGPQVDGGDRRRRALEALDVGGGDRDLACARRQLAG